jgi:hypothetical protein
MGPRQYNACLRFLKLFRDNGWEVLELYVTVLTKIKLRCLKGYIRYITPASFQAGLRCATCSGLDPKATEQRFREEMTRRGFTNVGKYVNNRTPVDCICPLGYLCCVRSHGVIDNNQGACITCAGKNPEMVAQQFYQNLQAIGAVALEPYVYSLSPVLCRCVHGILRRPRPANLSRQYGICHCEKRKSEHALYTWLVSIYGEKNVKYQSCYEWCKNPATDRYFFYDFELFDNIVLELDDAQHFRQVPNWSPPKRSRSMDVYKMYHAFRNNKAVIRIPHEDLFQKHKYDETTLRQLYNTIPNMKIGNISYVGNMNLYNQHHLDLQLANTSDLPPIIIPKKNGEIDECDSDDE